MSDNNPVSKEKPYDPFEAFRQMRDASMEAWAKVMTDAVQTDAYAQSTGAMLDTYLTSSAPFRDLMQKIISQALEELNLPSRSDFSGLAERLTHIEMKLDDIDSKLDAIVAKQSTEHGQASTSKAPQVEIE
jgi:hypothetical protein